MVTEIGTGATIAPSDRRDTNAAIVRRFVTDVLGGADPTALRELIAPEHIAHLPLGDHFGPLGLRIEIDDLHAAFPDLLVTLDDLIAADDRVARRFTLTGTHQGPFLGLPATGKGVVLAGMAIDRLENERVVECWVHLDIIGLLRQLDASIVLNADPLALR